MSPSKGCIYGAIASVLILVFVLAGIAFNAATIFDGDCITFEPPIRSCTLRQYLVQALVLTIIAAPFTHSFAFFLILFITLGLPIAGLVAGAIRSRARASS